MSLADFSSSLHYTGNSVFLAFLASLVAVAKRHTLMPLGRDLPNLYQGRIHQSLHRLDS
jgi:hypothetical protein